MMPAKRKRTDDNPPLPTLTIEWAAIRRAVRERLETRKWNKDIPVRINRSVRFDDDWSGSGGETETLDLLRRGFDVRAAAGLSHGEIPAKPRRRMRWGDDGDIDVGRALNGDDFPFSRWDERKRKPGLIIEAEWSFSWTVPGEVIAGYGAFLASICKRLEMEGYDLGLSLIQPGHSTYIGDGVGRRDLRFILKREGEASDYKVWSPAFSPAGFRIFGFTGIYLAGMRDGLEPSADLGIPAPSGEWGVLFNSDTRTMRVTIPGPGSVPPIDAEKMTDQMLAALPENA